MAPPQYVRSVPDDPTGSPAGLPGDPSGQAVPAAGPGGRAPASGARRVVDNARTIADGATDRGRRVTEAVGRRFESPLHDEWVASILGIALGLAFTVCFLTGIVDYLAQHPPAWFHLPTSPVNLYRVTEGTHVVTGIATIPLLLAKLWTVWPKLFAWPPVQGVATALERLSLIPLVGGSLFLLATGVANIDYWYSPMPFFFPTAHFWTAWLVVGALVIHVAAKAAVAGRAVGRGAGDPGGRAAPESLPAAAAPSPRLTRRGFVATVFASAGVLVLTVAGETVAPLRRLALLAPRNPAVGPQTLPVNQSAVEAGVTSSAVDPAYRLVVTGNCRRPRSFSLGDLASMPQRAAGLPITCVEGWSASADWRGVSLPALLRVVGAPAGAAVRVESLEAQDRLYASSVVDPDHAAHPDTLLALELNGETLDLDHGYPVRLIAPDRPGVLQTKWISRVVVL